MSDVHSPRYLMEYIARLSESKQLCADTQLVLWAGDMVDKGRVNALRPVVQATRRFCPQAHIVAAFGNEEYMDREHSFVEHYPEVEWLNDRYITLEVSGLRVAVYGSRGVIDKPTTWQQKHIPGIRIIYAKRLQRMRETLDRLRQEGYIVVLLTHYAPTYATLEGEDPKIWAYLGSRHAEKVLLETKPRLAVHGHAHHSKRTRARVGETLVVNVALPANHKLTFIDIREDGSITLSPE
ncbi:MAG: metallophosphoesterase [Crenarchaeota archaeon]|nr:metallophosphoesterase [Thermoproteota archaeon]